MTTLPEEAVEAMARALTAAADQFAEYARQHRAKDPPQYEKAKTNDRYEAMCRAAIPQPRPPADEAGWVLLPRNATNEMLENICCAMERPDWPVHAWQAWDAVILAAPTPTWGDYLQAMGGKK